MASAPSSGRRRALRAYATLALILTGMMILGVVTGPSGTGVTPSGALRALLHPEPARSRAIWDVSQTIVWEIRLPRVVVAALIGALLALAGVALQGLLMNPLADPYTVGASAGAAVGAAVAEVAGIAALLGGLIGILSAFTAAIAASALVYALARVNGRVSVQTFLLAGVVVGTLLWSLIPLLMTIAGRGDDLQRIYFYLIGSLQAADWSRAMLLAPFAMAAGALLWSLSRELNLMTLGEESAHHLGVAVEPLKRTILACGALATAAAVSIGGIIGFVGLVVPHMARYLVGPDHRSLVPAAALGGAILLVASDTVVRVWFNDMPVGVITAIVGAPVFCMLIRRRRAVAW